MVEKSSENPLKKRTSLRSYASRVFKESSVGMVSSLAHTDSARRRVFKVLALFFCLTGFLYQSGKFLSVVFQYPTSVDIDILRPGLFNVPAYTFCDNNGINRRIFCKKFPENCETPDEEFCKNYEHYCGENATLVPKRKYYSLNSDMTLEEMVELNVPMEDFVFQGSWSDDEKIKGPYLRMRDFNDPSYICYSFNDRVNNSMDPRQAKPSKLFRRPVDTFQFYVEDDEMFLPGNRAGILFSVHSPFQAVNPFETGIFMKPGRTYMVFVSMEEEILLKEPYQTNCINYTEIWERNDRAGPRNQEMCHQNCLADISVKCFNCVVPMLQFPRNERYCTEDDIKNHYNCPEDLDYQLKQCELNCRDDCRQTKYSYTLQERFRPNIEILNTTNEGPDNSITVQVFLEGDEVIVLKHSPKYMIVEVFSNIGGFIGCWLGINLLDITDIFEGFFRILRYSFKRK